MKLPRHPLPADQVIPVMQEKVKRSGARVDRMLSDLAAEITDQQKQAAAERERAARRERLKKAGILPPK